MPIILLIYNFVNAHNFVIGQIKLQWQESI